MKRISVAIFTTYLGEKTGSTIQDLFEIFSVFVYYYFLVTSQCFFNIYVSKTSEYYENITQYIRKYKWKTDAVNFIFKYMLIFFQLKKISNHWNEITPSYG